MTRRHVLIKSKIEYVSHALNYIEGCSHGCCYCYMRQMKRVAYPEWCLSRVVPFAVALLQSDLDRLKEKPSKVLVSSSHDPCQPAKEIADLTEDILTVLADRAVPTWLLTKGGLRSLRYLGLLKRPGARLGVSITTHDERERERWEPGASSIHDRFMALVLVDWVVIGKWNHRREAQALAWPRIREEAEAAFSRVGIPYLIKSELREAR